MEKPTRRRLLAAGFTGTALGLAGSRVASAGTDTTTPTGDEPPAPPAATTTLPPQRPTEEDIALLQFAESFELAARDLYQAAVDAGVEDDAVAAMRDNHQASASIIKGILGTRGAESRADDVFSRYESDFAGTDIGALATVAYELESTAVATHTELVRDLLGIDGARLIASIIVVEARHAAVLADIAGLGNDYDALFENDAEALPAGATSGG